MESRASGAACGRRSVHRRSGARVEPSLQNGRVSPASDAVTRRDAAADPTVETAINLVLVVAEDARELDGDELVAVVTSGHIYRVGRDADGLTAGPTWSLMVQHRPTFPAFDEHSVGTVGPFVLDQDRGPGRRRLARRARTEPRVAFAHDRSFTVMSSSPFVVRARTPSITVMLATPRLRSGGRPPARPSRCRTIPGPSAQPARRIGLAATPGGPTCVADWGRLGLVNRSAMSTRSKDCIIVRPAITRPVRERDRSPPTGTHAGRALCT